MKETSLNPRHLFNSVEQQTTYAKTLHSLPDEIL